jgi:hypothetical protein
VTSTILKLTKIMITFFAPLATSHARDIVPDPDLSPAHLARPDTSWIQMKGVWTWMSATPTCLLRSLKSWEGARALAPPTSFVSTRRAPTPACRVTDLAKVAAVTDPIRVMNVQKVM